MWHGWSKLFTLKMYSHNSWALCNDALAEFVDISFGDAWSRTNSDNVGISICVSWAAIGENLLLYCKKIN